MSLTDRGDIDCYYHLGLREPGSNGNERWLYRATQFRNWSFIIRYCLESYPGHLLLLGSVLYLSRSSCCILSPIGRAAINVVEYLLTGFCLRAHVSAWYLNGRGWSCCDGSMCVCMCEWGAAVVTMSSTHST